MTDSVETRHLLGEATGGYTECSCGWPTFEQFKAGEPESRHIIADAFASIDGKGLAEVLIQHTRLSIDGLCYCGYQGRLGESFATHQAESVKKWLSGETP